MPANPPPPRPRRVKIPYPPDCLAFDERVWRTLPPQRGLTAGQLALDLGASVDHAEAALVRLQCATPQHAQFGGSGRWYRLGGQFSPRSIRLVFGAPTLGGGAADDERAPTAEGAPARHLLSMPGRAPIEVDVVEDGDLPCPACGAILDRGDVLHGPTCMIAREAAADASRDITTDGSAAFADAARLRLAREFAASQLGEDADDEPAEVAARRRDLVVGYLAGSHHTAQELAGIVQTGTARLVEDVATWILGTSVAGEEGR